MIVRVQTNPSTSSYPGRGGDEICCLKSTRCSDRQVKLLFMSPIHCAGPSTQCRQCSSTSTSQGEAACHICCLLLPEAIQVWVSGSTHSTSRIQSQHSGGAGFLLKWIHLQIFEPSQHSRELTRHRRFFFLQKSSGS